MLAAPRRRFAAAVAAVSVVATVAVGLLGAPWIYAEFGLAWDGPLVGSMPAVPASGRWVDDYYLVEQLDADSWAIGEPRYYQGNYSYLLRGRERAVLFDGGSGVHDIVPLVRSLTTLPVTVVASHLHFDHVGALGRLDRTAMLDLPELRHRSKNGTLTLRRYEFLGYIDGLAPPQLRVDEWWAPGVTLDLGGRRLQVLHTPGHTPSSLAMHDTAQRALYTGDFIYPSTLYAFLPGASRRVYLETTQQLLRTLAPDTMLYTAHLGDTSAGIGVPRMVVADLQALAATLHGISNGEAQAEGVFPRRFAVRGDLEFATGFAWNNR